MRLAEQGSQPIIKQFEWFQVYSLIYWYRSISVISALLPPPLHPPLFFILTVAKANFLASCPYKVEFTATEKLKHYSLEMTFYALSFFMFKSLLNFQTFKHYKNIIVRTRSLKICLDNKMKVLNYLKSICLCDAIFNVYENESRCRKGALKKSSVRVVLWVKMFHFLPTFLF